MVKLSLILINTPTRIVVYTWKILSAIGSTSLICANYSREGCALRTKRVPRRGQGPAEAVAQNRMMYDTNHTQNGFGRHP